MGSLESANGGPSNETGATYTAVGFGGGGDVRQTIVAAA